MKKFFYIIAAFFLWAKPAPAIVLSENAIDIGINFDRQLLLVEGVLDSRQQDVIIVLTGPDTTANLWQKKQIFNVWVNGAKKSFANVPSYYFWGATDVELLGRMTDWQRYIFLLGPDSLGRHFYDQLKGKRDTKKIYSDGLLESLEEKKLYFAEPERIFKKNNTFYLPITIEPHTPIGFYHLTAYYIDGWRVARIERASLLIEKKGLNSFISNFAERNSLLYGVTAIIIAIGFGYISSVVYNKIILPRKQNKEEEEKQAEEKQKLANAKQKEKEATKKIQTKKKTKKGKSK